MCLEELEMGSWAEQHSTAAAHLHCNCESDLAAPILCTGIVILQCLYQLFFMLSKQLWALIP